MKKTRKTYSDKINKGGGAGCQSMRHVYVYSVSHRREVHLHIIRTPTSRLCICGRRVRWHFTVCIRGKKMKKKNVDYTLLGAEITDRVTPSGIYAVHSGTGILSPYAAYMCTARN